MKTLYFRYQIAVLRVLALWITQSGWPSPLKSATAAIAAAGVTLGVGVDVAAVAAPGVGRGGGVGRGLGVGDVLPVGVGVALAGAGGVGDGDGVCVGVAVGVRVAVGVGDALTTVTMPVIPIEQCGLQKYGEDPTVLKVCEKVAPWLRIPESHIPLGVHGVPEVVL